MFKNGWMTWLYDVANTDGDIKIINYDDIIKDYQLH